MKAGAAIFCLSALAFQTAARAQVIPEVDLSGPWKLTRASGPSSTVALPFAGSSQPGGRYTLERTVAFPPDVPRDGLTIMPGSMRGAYALFVNGTLVGRQGNMQSPWTPTAHPVLFDLPAAAFGQDGELKIRIEVDLPELPVAGATAASRFDTPKPFLSTRRRTADSVQASEARALLRFAMIPVWAFTGFLFAFFIWLFSRNRVDARTYRWISAAFVANAVFDVSTLFSLHAPASTPEQAITIISVMTLDLTRLCAAEFGIRLVGWPRPAWRWPAYAALFAYALSPESHLQLTRLPFALIQLAIFATALYKRQGRDTKFIAGLLALYEIQAPLPIPPLFLGPVQFSHNPLARWLIGVLMVVEMVRRAAADRKERERLAQEIEAARQVQALLIAPPEGEAHPYRIDAAYLPAQEVGGDFYQIWRSPDGALLVVVGDVSGKGLKAAMTVSLIVGALRSESGSEPGKVLANLNRVLCARGHDGGFVTCCCLRLSGEGVLDIATAGHPAPFVNGSEITIDGSLPLGLIPAADLATRRLTLAPGDEITLISDGVVEAEDTKRELFGFDRTLRLCGRAAAREIAETAKAWGQTDDITVVTVRRSPE